MVDDVLFWAVRPKSGLHIQQITATDWRNEAALLELLILQWRTDVLGHCYPADG